MLIGKIPKLILVVFFLFALLYFAAANFLGPGVGDSSIRIINSYEYNDSGGYEKNIIRTNSEGEKEIVIDSRVDDYELKGDKLLVARRPREIYRVDDVAKSRLSEDCEYWIIDTKEHAVSRVSESYDLKCN